MSSVSVIAVDAGGTKLLVGVVAEGLVVRHRSRRLWSGSSCQAVTEDVIAGIEEAHERAPQARAVGLGIPSLVDQRTGESIFSNHLALDGVNIGALVKERVGLPVCVDNDANAAVLAEQRFGAARGAADVVGLTIGTGIGGGLVLDGRLYRGAFGTGAELGHMVVDPDGPPCPGACPNRGCLEAVASGRAIGAEGAAAARREPASALGRALARGEEITGSLVTDAAKSGDRVSQEVLELVGHRLGIGISSLVNIFNPEVVVVGGGGAAAGELLLGPARSEVARRALGPNAQAVRIVGAHFGDEAGMLGAALIALDTVSSQSNTLEAR